MSPAATSISALLRRWEQAQDETFAFLDSLGATEDAHTMTIRLLPQAISSPDDFADSLGALVRNDGAWAFLTTSPDGAGQQFALAMPVSERPPPDGLTFAFVEIHTLLVAWWLTTAWRARQLARAGLALATSGDVIASAACVRSLVETAAACWVDGSKLVAAWDDMKRAGKPIDDAQALSRRNEMLKVLNEVAFGAKFDDRAPELKRSWGKIGRTNVLGQVEKLAKACGAALQDDYQWLCNTVHPSIGNTFAFSAPPLRHESGTHVVTWFAGRPIHIESGGEVTAEDTVERATARAAYRALDVLHLTLEAALRAIDDMALTTGAPDLAREPYWRNIRRVDRNQPCPCRSGLKAKRCAHAWGDASSAFPGSFLDEPLKPSRVD